MFFPVRTITVITCLVSLCIPVVIFYFGVAKHTVTLTAGIGWSILFFLLAGVIFYSWKIIAIGSIFTCSVALVCLINLALLPVIYLSPLYRNDQTYQSLRGVRNIQGIDRLDYYHLGDAKLPQVWDIGKVVKTLPKTKRGFPLWKVADCVVFRF